jgi:hypothetical protein
MSQESVDKVKVKFEDMVEKGDNTGWYEGYVSALADHNIITEDEFESLMHFIGTDMRNTYGLVTTNN